MGAHQIIVWLAHGRCRSQTSGELCCSLVSARADHISCMQTKPQWATLYVYQVSVVLVLSLMNWIRNSVLDKAALGWWNSFFCQVSVRFPKSPYVQSLLHTLGLCKQGEWTGFSVRPSYHAHSQPLVQIRSYARPLNVALVSAWSSCSSLPASSAPGNCPLLKAHSFEPGISLCWAHMRRRNTIPSWAKNFS